MNMMIEDLTRLRNEIDRAIAAADMHETEKALDILEQIDISVPDILSKAGRTSYDR